MCRFNVRVFLCTHNEWTFEPNSEACYATVLGHPDQRAPGSVCYHLWHDHPLDRPLLGHVVRTVTEDTLCPRCLTRPDLTEHHFHVLVRGLRRDLAGARALVAAAEADWTRLGVRYHRDVPLHVRLEPRTAIPDVGRETLQRAFAPTMLHQRPDGLGFFRHLAECADSLAAADRELLSLERPYAERCRRAQEWATRIRALEAQIRETGDAARRWVELSVEVAGMEGAVAGVLADPVARFHCEQWVMSLPGFQRAAMGGRPELTPEQYLTENKFHA